MHIDDFLNYLHHEEDERDLFLKCDWEFTDKEAAKKALNQFGLDRSRNPGQMDTRLMLIAFALRHQATGKFIAYSRYANRYSGMSRYYGKNYNFRKIVEEIDKLEAKGLINHDQQTPGSHLKCDPRQSSYRATKKLIDAISHLETRFIHHDVIRLRAMFDQKTNKMSFKKHPGRKYVSRLIPYEDSEVSIAYRNEISHINQFMATIKFQWRGMENQRVGLYNWFDADAILITPLFITRSFCRKSFFLYGRCHGFWQNEKKILRPDIILNGETTCEPDFSQLHLNLAYLSKNLTPPEDAYEIEGYDRKMIKTAVPILLNASSEKSANGALVKEFDIRDDYAQDIIEDIKNRHSAIAELFHNDLGVKFMFIESCILVEAMKLMVDERIPFIPIHDGFRVPISKGYRVKEIMQEAFSSRYPSFIAPVKLNPIDLHSAHDDYPDADD